MVGMWNNVMGWACGAYGWGEGVYRVLVVKLEGRRPLEKPRHRWVDNIRTDLQEVGGGYVAWIGLTQDRDRWRTLVSAVMNLRVPWNVENLLTSCKPVSFSRRTLHHGVSKWVSACHMFGPPHPSCFHNANDTNTNPLLLTWFSTLRHNSCVSDTSSATKLWRASFLIILNTFQERPWGQSEPFCLPGWSWYDCERFFTTNSLVRIPNHVSVTRDKSVKHFFVGRHSADPSYTLLYHKCATYWTIRHLNTVCFNRWAAARYRALASIIPGRERFSWNW